MMIKGQDKYVCMLCLLLSQGGNFRVLEAVPSGATTSATNAGSTTLDPRRIRLPGWEKVGQLAKELLRLTSVAVSTAQANKLKALYNALEPYDKNAIEVHLRSQQPNP